MTKSKRMSTNQQAYVAYVSHNPGCSTADVDRACRWNPRAGHKWVYDGVGRLLSRRLLRSGQVRAESDRGGAVGLYTPEQVEEICAGVTALAMFAA